MGAKVLRDQLSMQVRQSSSLPKVLHGISSMFLLTLVFTSTACNNIGSLANRKPSTEIEFADPNSGTGGMFQLNGVYASQQSPGSMFDMVGVDAQFDTYCAGTSGPCVCEYTYVSPGIGTITDQGTVQYQESNLLRCSNVVPSGISSFDVKVLATGSSDYSNTITTNLSGGAFVNTNYTDLAKEEAYQPVKRFQCRKRAYISNPLSTNMIDPIQSEDPKIIYPFNYYTTNVAASLWEMQQSSTQDWDCTLTPTNDRTVHWWANPNVFSASGCTESFCAGDGELMYPQNDLASGKIPVSNLSANGKRRGSFHLAKQAYGVFQVPVIAAIGPDTYTSSKLSTTLKPIGYAARPIPTTSGSSTCPSITLPANAEWVKLWNFRATDITPPKFVKESLATLNSAIACNPIAGVFPSCDNPGSSGMSTEVTDFRGISLSTLTSSPPIITFSSPTANTCGGSLPCDPQASPGTAITANDTLASRVAILVGSGTVNACYDISAMGDGQEAWEPSPFGFLGLGLAEIQGLPWGVYAQSSSLASCGTSANWVDDAVGGVNSVSCNNRMKEDAPADTQITTDTLNASNYTDQIFVITKPDVDDTGMRNQALSVSHYKPVTYRTASDCNGVSRIGCAIGKEIHWDINIKDIGAPTGPDQYPLCVLQFSD